MNDIYTTAINTQRATIQWMDVLAENLTNVYSPGYRENKVNFKTFLGGAVVDQNIRNFGQGKSIPGTSNENLFFEGTGFFVLRGPEGNVSYTRLGEFTFDSEGVYKAKNGDNVQGYILNDKGEIMSGTKSISADLFEETALKGGAMSIPTTNIKLWIDPNNGKFLGKYDEYEIKNDGTIYGKADGGNRSVPLYKIATANFHNPSGLFEVKDGLFIETDESGEPVVGRGEIRSGLLEQSNIDFKANTAGYQMAKVQMELVNALIKSNKDLLQSAIEMATQ
ncbi:MAG: flagellar hook basal-body protein [Cyanobacteria bacterium SIG28]|nr:flagellar hook basal-body protein [Cyanobacteria bacterium SIG28]